MTSQKDRFLWIKVKILIPVLVLCLFFLTLGQALPAESVICWEKGALFAKETPTTDCSRCYSQASMKIKISAPAGNCCCTELSFPALFSEWSPSPTLSVPAYLRISNFTFFPVKFKENNSPSQVDFPLFIPLLAQSTQLLC